MAVLTASANIRGREIDLSLAWTDRPGLPRSLRVVRRRFAYPTGPSDGLVVFNLADLFAPGDTPWARIDARRFLLHNTRAEGGVLQAEIAEHYISAGDAEPRRVTVRIYDAAGGFESTVVPLVTRVTRTSGTSPGFDEVQTLAIFTQPSGSEILAGTVVLSIVHPLPAGSPPPPGGTVSTVTDYTESPAGTDAPLVTTTYIPQPDVFSWTPAARDITAATKASPIEVTTAHDHLMKSGATVVISGVAGNTAANGTWTVFVTGPTTFTLTGSTGNANYAGGGLATPAAQLITFAREAKRSTTATVRRSAPLDISFVTTLPGATAPVPICQVDFTDAPNPDTGDIGRSVTIADQEPSTPTGNGFEAGLLPGSTYYYTAFEDTGSGLALGTTWTASAVASNRYYFAKKLFALLPAVHRYYDDPGSGQQGSWQLRRFLEIFGPGLDQARSLGEGLASLHDLFEVRADFLPFLARLIGWEPDRTLPTARQRSDVLFAPDVYATVGTVPNIRAMVNRATGWDCQVKEFVNNVFLTNAPERIRLWEIWEADSASGVFSPSALVAPRADTFAANDSIDARPAVVADPGGGAPWLFWHSDRTAASDSPLKRRIWMAQTDGIAPPVVIVPDTGSLGDTCPTAVADVIAGTPVIRLFWSSTRSGRPDLWGLTLTSTAGGWSIGPPVQLTNHPAGDDFPSAVVQPGGPVWLFWQSSRRGPTDIWAMTLTAGVWSSPQRITTGNPRDLMPTAVIDGGQVNLFWSADQGDRSRIHQAIFDGTSWSAPIHFSANLPAATPPPVTVRFRDEAPAAVTSAGSLWVFWHSDRDGIPRIYGSQRTGTTWSAPFPVTVGRSAEKDPAPFAAAAGSLRLFFRTQRGGEIYRSRTVDFSKLSALKTSQADDRWHYTYSTAGTPTAFYARDAVGLYMTPKGTGNNADHQSEIDRVQALVEPFRPVPARFVWILEPQVTAEIVYSPTADIAESYTDNFPFVETLGAVGETTLVSLPGWVVIHSNTPGNVSASSADLTTLRNRSFFPAPT